MATYYVDPAASGNNDGTSWDDAFTDLQSAATAAQATDTVYCRGSQTITQTIAPVNAGSVGNLIRYIGCNASGVNDGTYFQLNGNGNNISGMTLNNNDYTLFENFKIHSCLRHGIECVTSYTDYAQFNNVWLTGNTGAGLYANIRLRSSLFYRCKFNGNGAKGVYSTISSAYNLCEFSGNTGHGCEEAESNELYNCCLFTGNTTSGLRLYGSRSVLNCVFDSNGENGIEMGYSDLTIIQGCRFTNHNASGKLGIAISGGRVCLVACYFGNNATDITDGMYEVLRINGATDHVIFGGTDTNHGYTTPGSDFNLRSDASLRSLAIPLPLD